MSDPEADYHNAEEAAEGTAAGETPPSRTNHRKSKLFFGICDMRTATVALDVLNIAFTFVVVILLTIMYLIQGGPFVLQNIMYAISGGLVSAGLSGIGLYSAMKWNLRGLYFVTGGFIVLLLFRLITLDWVDIVLTSLLVYPHLMFVMEIRSGIMTEETFPQEEYLSEGGKDFVEMAHNYISPAKSLH
jgi:hypothetical protein